MALNPGARLGPYEILSSLGAGGMGEVYRARDTRLNRDVAIKVLPDSFANDAERLARFTREAQTLASLNHPNIAGIHGLEESGGVTALVMELVEGEDLSQRIARGAIPIDEALPIAKQIAEALEAAHEQGIIHRDLKPANIKVRADGTVKVLDFGLAKAMDPVGGVPNMSQSPTITTPAMTHAGIILGTAAYMSPEQARGKTVDRRADIWAFGAVLYEMLTARRAFEGEDIAITLAAVMMKEPDWRALPAAMPVALRRLLTRCLKKDPKARMRDIGEARLQIEELLSGTPEEVGVAVTPVPPTLWRRMLPWAAAGVLAIGLALVVMAVIALRHAGEVAPAAGPVEFPIAAPQGTTFGGPPPGAGSGIATQAAVSPDGRNIAFVAGVRPGYQIWLRPAASVAARPIPGTEGGTYPFWSPDSRSLAFFADGKLKRVLITGGPPTVICDAPGGRGGSWSRDNVILFAPAFGGAGLQRVSVGSGAPVVVTTLDRERGKGHRWPHFLPDGRHFLYTEITGPCCPAPEPGIVKISSLDENAAAITLLQADSSVSYASGHLLFARAGNLMAQPFDADTRQLTGDAFPLVELVDTEGSRYTSASVSENGTLVYGRGASQLSQLTWFDRAGHPLGTLGQPGQYRNLALSPDESRVAVTWRTSNTGNMDLSIIDVARNIPSRLTFDPGTDGSPVFSADSTRVAYAGQRSGKGVLLQHLVNGTAPAEPLHEVSGVTEPSDWSVNNFIAYTAITGNFPPAYDVWILPLSGDRKPFPFAQTGLSETSGMFSRDGRWIAYVSNELGQPNVYVRPFLRDGPNYPISRDGGSHPAWRADGKELFYLGPDGSLMAVAIDSTGPFHGGVPKPLFPLRLGSLAVSSNNTGQVYAANKDGQRFLVNAALPSSVAPLTVVLDWPATIQK